jgi:hypothetical protein
MLKVEIQTKAKRFLEIKVKNRTYFSLPQTKTYRELATKCSVPRSGVRWAKGVGSSGKALAHPCSNPSTKPQRRALERSGGQTLWRE